MKHETGDRALRLFANTLRESVRDADVVCRYGGGGVRGRLLRLYGRRGRVRRPSHAAALAQKISSGDVPTFTSSFGLADSSYASTFDDVLRLADTAVLRAKEEGRDRLVIADDRDSSPQVQPAS